MVGDNVLECQNIVGVVALDESSYKIFECERLVFKFLAMSTTALTLSFLTMESTNFNNGNVRLHPDRYWSMEDSLGNPCHIKWERWKEKLRSH